MYVHQSIVPVLGFALPACTGTDLTDVVSAPLRFGKRPCCCV